MKSISPANIFYLASIDPECHLGSHRALADDFYSETSAAAAAGVTTWGMQLVSLAITGGAEKVKGPADIPSFTQSDAALL